MTGWILSSSILIAVVIGLRYLLKGKIAPGLQWYYCGAIFNSIFDSGAVGRTKISSFPCGSSPPKDFPLLACSASCVRQSICRSIRPMTAR